MMKYQDVHPTIMVPKMRRITPTHAHVHDWWSSTARLRSSNTGCHWLLSASCSKPCTKSLWDIINHDQQACWYVRHRGSGKRKKVLCAGKDWVRSWADERTKKQSCCVSHNRLRFSLAAAMHWGGKLRLDVISRHIPSRVRGSTGSTGSTVKGEGEKEKGQWGARLAARSRVRRFPKMLKSNEL